MALYEYHCQHCGARFEKRMSMKDVVQKAPCPSCKKQAQKVIGQFAVVGRAEAGVEDGPAPWDDEGGMDGDDDLGMGGHSHDFDHGHSHGPGGHTHGPGGHTH
jgi:putative FmdB family regulatory protein